MKIASKIGFITKVLTQTEKLGMFLVMLLISFLVDEVHNFANYKAQRRQPTKDTKTNAQTQHFIAHDSNLPFFCLSTY
jgi:hypothetical protein